MIHLTTHQLSSYLDRELPESSTELVRRHLDACPACTRSFAAFREQEAMLDRILIHDPGEEFFERFADEVLGASKSAPAGQSSDRRIESDRRVVERRVTERRVMERRMPVISTRGDATPASTPAPISRRSARQPAIPWFAAATLCLIVGAIGYTLPRPWKSPEPSGGPAGPTMVRLTGQATPPAPAAGAEGPAPMGPAMSAPPSPSPSPLPLPLSLASSLPQPAVRPPESRAWAPPSLPPAEESIVPVRRIINTIDVVPAPVAPSSPRTAPQPSSPAAPALDEFAAAPPPAAPLIGAARTASRAAALDSSAANLDAAGSAWEQVIPALSGAEQTLARQKLAEARYRAWVASPDPYRAAAATASLRSFLVLSPPGPRHDLAKTWLKRIHGG